MEDNYVERTICGFPLPEVITEYVEDGGSVLLVGAPGIGKSTEMFKAFGSFVEAILGCR